MVTQWTKKIYVFKHFITIFTNTFIKFHIKGTFHSHIWWIFCIKMILQRVTQSFKCLEFFHVNKSCTIGCCGNKMHQIIENVIQSRGLELKLSLLWRTTISGQHLYFGEGSEKWKVCKPLLPLYFNRSWGMHTYATF